MEDGRRQVGEFLFAGDLFGWEALDNHDFGAEAVTPVTLRRYARRDLERLADQDRDVARKLRELSSSRLRSGREHMVLLGRKTASERIASFLLEMAARSNADARSTIELPMSRSDMGDYLGLTIETVCRRLTRLRLDGTIAINGTKIAIRNRARAWRGRVRADDALINQVAAAQALLARERRSGSNLDLNQCTIFSATYGLPNCLFGSPGPDSSGPGLRTEVHHPNARTLSRNIHDMHRTRDPSGVTG